MLLLLRLTCVLTSPGFCMCMCFLYLLVSLVFALKCTRILQDSAVDLAMDSGSGPTDFGHWWWLWAYWAWPFVVVFGLCGFGH